MIYIQVRKFSMKRKQQKVMIETYCAQEQKAKLNEAESNFGKKKLNKENKQCFEDIYGLKRIWLFQIRTLQGFSRTH